MSTAPRSVVEGSLAYPGWRVVFACFTMAIFSWTFGFYGQGVFLARLHALHGWSVAEISSATTGCYLLSAVLIASVGDAVARFGPRAVLVGGVLCLAASVALLGRVAELWQLYVVFVGLAFGWAATSIVAITTTIGRWFDGRRGLAISLALNGASMGGIVGVPALVAAIDRLGFASALLTGALLTAGVLVPLLTALVREDAPAASGSAPSRPRGAPGLGLALSRRKLVRSPAFWAVAGPFAAALFVQVGFVVHQFALVESVAGAGAASLAVGVTAVAAVVGRIGLGTVIDRIDQRLATAGSILLQAIALAILASASTGLPLVVASGLFGLSVGNLITLPALIVQREFDAASFGGVVALSTAIGQFLYAFGPGTLGWMRDLAGGYGMPLTLCVGIEIGAAAAILLGRPRGSRRLRGGEGC